MYQNGLILPNSIHWKYYPVKIGSIYFLESSDKYKFGHIIRCHATGITLLASSYLGIGIKSFFKCFEFFKFNMLDEKPVLIRLKMKISCLTKNIFCFLLINTNSQQLIHRIHGFGCQFYLQTKTKNLVDFISFYCMIFTLNLIN